MKTDKERMDWLEKQILRSGYSTEFVQGQHPPMDRVILKTMVGSGPWQKHYGTYSVRDAIDKAMEET